MSDDILKTDIVPKFIEMGELKFYKYLLVLALQKLIEIEQGSYKGLNPCLEYLEYSDRFLFVYRRKGDESYLKISKIFRKIAHKIYRIMLKKQMINKNTKFLNLV